MPVSFYICLREINILTFLITKAYHSQIKEFSSTVGNMSILPLRTQYRGPAPSVHTDNDIIDESLYYFKANVFFRTYEIKVNKKFLNYYCF